MNHNLLRILTHDLAKLRDYLYDLEDVTDINKASDEVQAVYLRLDEAHELLERLMATQLQKVADAKPAEGGSG